MQLVHPYREQKPNMVLVEGMREGKSGLTVEKPLVSMRARASTQRMCFASIGRKKNERILYLCATPSEI